MFRPQSISVLKASLAFLLSAALAGPASAQIPAARVMLSPAVQHDIAPSQTFVGTVMPLRRSVVGSAVDGRVVDFPFKVGDRVEAGQTLCQMLVKTIGLQITQAEAEWRLRQQEYEELKNGSRPEEVKEAGAKLAARKALLDYAVSRFDRMRKLHEGPGGISLEEMEQSLSAKLAAEAALQEAEHAFSLVKLGPRAEKILQAKHAAEAAEEKVKYYEDIKTKYTVKSPFNGYVVAEFTEVGEWVSSGKAVAEVIDLDNVEIEVHVPQQYISYLTRQSTAQITAEGVLAKPLTSSDIRVVPLAEARSRSYPVRVRLQNLANADGPLLKGGMVVRVTLPVGVPQKSLAVPKDALVLGGAKPRLIVYTPSEADPKKGTPKFIEVSLGAADGGLIEVLGPIRAGDLVVVEGNERVLPIQGLENAGEVPTEKYLRSAQKPALAVPPQTSAAPRTN